MINIAIDGPSGAGKSSLSRRAAEALGFLYIDTGALYRAVGLAALREGIAPDDATAVAALAERISVTLQTGAEGQSVFLNGEDVTAQLRSEQVSRYASAVSAAPRVRALLLETQRRLAAENDVVMDGRDIGTVVLPHADVKIFLTADAEVRAKRRYDELQQKGDKTPYAQILAETKQRDKQDSERAIAPLKQAADAVLLDTSDDTVKQSVDAILAIVRRKLG